MIVNRQISAIQREARNHKALAGDRCRLVPTDETGRALSELGALQRHCGATIQTLRYKAIRGNYAALAVRRFWSQERRS
jgi:hypothetical protein